MTDQPDTPGDALAWADENMAMHWIDRYASGIDAEPQMDRILKCVTVASDTAGPSDHAGLVERLEDLIPNTLMFDNAGYYDTPLTFAVREAIAALSRAPEAVAWTVYDWEYTNPITGKWSYARTPERAEKLMREGVKLTPVYVPDATPPAPQPALALIEENDRLRTLLKEARRFYPKHDHDPRVNLIGAEIDAALASAKRFKEGA